MHSELLYTLEGVAFGLRNDGRNLLDCRECSVEFDVLPHTSGSCQFNGFGTELVVGVVAVLAQPDVGTPAMGRIIVSVSREPSNSIAAGLSEREALVYGAPDSEGKRLWLERALLHLCGPSTVPDALRTLCIAPGRQCWELRAHVQLIRSDGCPLDAAALALRCALQNTRLPRITIAAPVSFAESGGDVRDHHQLDGCMCPTGRHYTSREPGGIGPLSGRLDFELDETLDSSQSFDASELPLYITLASLGGRLVADCTAKERAAASCAISLAVDAHGEIAALCGGGGLGIHSATLPSAIATSRLLAERLQVGVAGAVAVKTRS